MCEISPPPTPSVRFLHSCVFLSHLTPFPHVTPDQGHTIMDWSSGNSLKMHALSSGLLTKTIVCSFCCFVKLISTILSRVPVWLWLLHLVVGHVHWRAMLAVCCLLPLYSLLFLSKAYLFSLLPPNYISIIPLAAFLLHNSRTDVMSSVWKSEWHWWWLMSSPNVWAVNPSLHTTVFLSSLLEQGTKHHNEKNKNTVPQLSSFSISEHDIWIVNPGHLLCSLYAS